jgi:hypothetical protein
MASADHGAFAQPIRYLRITLLLSHKPSHNQPSIYATGGCSIRLGSFRQALIERTAWHQLSHACRECDAVQSVAGSWTSVIPALVPVLEGPNLV